MTFTYAAILIPATFVAICIALSLRRARGTTLVAPHLWAFAALGAVCASAIATSASPPDAPAGWIHAAQYTAGMMTFCPLVAVLGAKRPQDKAWQLIVLALAAVSALPAVEDLLYHYGQPIAPHTAWQWFAVALLVVEVANYLPTVYGAAALIYVVAQVVLLGDYLPYRVEIAPAWRAPAALALTATACLTARICGACQKPLDAALLRLQRDFRNQYGLMWSVRIEQRAVATRQGTPENAAGDQDRTAAAPTAAQESGSSETSAAAREYIALLKRFVSREWIEARLNADSRARSAASAQEAT